MSILGSAMLLCGAALAGSLGSSPQPNQLEEVYKPQRVALLVGIDSYLDPDLDTLRFSAKDARDLGDVLAAESPGGFDQVTIIDQAAGATRAAIEEAIVSATANLQRDDTFLLYLSGHGTLTLHPTNGTRLWFLPSDGVLTKVQTTGLPVDWLEERVGSLVARRRVLILDTCHNGREKSSLANQTSTALAGLRGDPPPPRSLRDVSESEARLYAAQYYQPAMEDPELENGVYTHFLIDALTDATPRSDLDKDGLVDVTEAHDWARDHTIQHTGGMQVPRAEYRIVGREEIYLAGNMDTRSKAERALLAAADAVLHAGTIIVDGQARGELPNVVDVAPGSHVLEIRDAQDQPLARKRIRLAAGETYMIDDLLAKRSPKLEFLAGGFFRHGPGAGVLHPAALELQLRKVDFIKSPDWVVPTWGLRASLATGAVEEQGPLTAVSAGLVGLGIGAGFKPLLLPIAAGPQIDLVLPWRSFNDSDGDHLQGTLALAPGIALDARLSLPQNRHLALRYHARIMPFEYAQVWTSSIEHSIGIGIGQP